MNAINICPLCKSKNLSYLYNTCVSYNDLGWKTILQNNELYKSNYLINFCNKCTLLFRNTRFSSSDLKIMYGFEDLNFNTPVNIYKKRAYDIIKFVAKHSGSLFNNYSILDIGGGGGQIAHWFAKDFNCSCDIFEFDISNKSSGLGVNYVSSILGKKYELITINHVLEHINYPVDFLLPFINSLKKDGLLYIEVPFELIHYYIFKTKGHYEHLNYFGVKSLHNLGSYLGLQPLKIEIKLGFGNSIPVVAGLFKKRLKKITMMHQ